MFLDENVRRVCWLSGGVSSIVAAYLYRYQINEYVYIDIDDQHPDTMRFIKDFEQVVQRPVTILKSEYNNVNAVIAKFRFINSPYGAKCTDVLKRRVRKEYEYKYRDRRLIYIWGLDCDEKKRAERITASNPKQEHLFPLIYINFTKKHAHEYLRKEIGIRRPLMYDMGYLNNNCVGCVKGGMYYWNMIRKDFPDVFAKMAAIERDIGRSCIKGVFLDELDPERGRKHKEIDFECGIACELPGGDL
jgi:hypothetical protein